MACDLNVMELEGYLKRFFFLLPIEEEYYVCPWNDASDVFIPIRYTLYVM